MIGPRWCIPGSPVSSLCRARSSRAFQVCAAVALAIALILAVHRPGLAQIRPEVRDRVVPAVVQILVIAEVSDGGIVRPEPVFSGSGTLVSPTGLILTNWHVVDMVSHQRTLDATGLASTNLIEAGVIVLMSDGENRPVPRYIAETLASDPALDLAVLQITDDELGPVDPNALDLPFVPVGDSDEIDLGDPIDLFGFPGIGGGALTYTTGVVSGFITAPGIGRVWIYTDATMASGSSGGTAINREGELIGVPTQGTLSGCRPADMNLDGRIDSRDEDCVVEPGSIGQLRPVNIALDLLGADTGPREDGGSDGSAPPPPDLFDFLPGSPPLDHGPCFRTVDDGREDFNQMLQRFSGVPGAADRLEEWGWQASAFRQFGCDGPPEGEAGWIDISLHLFADASSAQEAVDYYTEVRLNGTSLFQVDPPGIGDHATALSGPAINGTEFTVYASQGPLLVRVTGVSPSGIPFTNVLTVAQAVLADARRQPQLAPPTRPIQEIYLPASAFLPPVPAVRHSECFDIVDEGAYVSADVAATPRAAGVSQSQFDELGWQDGAYMVFTCLDPPAGRAAQIDIGVHQFQDEASAQQALPVFSAMFALNGTQHRDCGAAANLVVCVNARSLTGSPLSDVAFVLQQVTAAIP